MVPVPVVWACSTPRFSNTLPVPALPVTFVFVMLNVPLVSLMNREALPMAVLVSGAEPWFVSVVAFRVKLLPVSAPVTVVPPVPVTVPEATSRRSTENGLGPEFSVPNDKPSTPVVLRFSAAEDVNW